MSWPNDMGTIPTGMQGATLLADATDDHGLMHRQVGTILNTLGTTLGTTAGTNLLRKALVAGDQLFALNSGGTPYQVVTLGTSNNSVLGSPTVTGGTVSGQIQNNGTLANGVYGTALLVGGTHNSAVLGTPVIQTWNNWVQATDMGTMLGTATVPLKQGTMSVATGATSKYDISDKVTFTQGGTVMYGYIVAVPSGTTIVICGGDDYLYGTTAITLGSYSKSQTPNGFPYWFNCGTSNFTGFAANPLVVSTLKFAMNGRLVTMQFDIQGTSSAGTFTFNGPVACNPADTYVQPIVTGDNGALQGTPGCIGFSSGGGSQINIGRTWTSFSANTYGGFTSSGVKTAIGMFQYPC